MFPFDVEQNFSDRYFTPPDVSEAQSVRYNFAANKCDNVVANKSRLSTCRFRFTRGSICFYWDTCHAKRGKLMR